MGKIVKAVCECGNWNEDDLKPAEIRSDWENTSSGWKVIHVLMCIPTGAFWVGVILAKMFIIEKKLVCLHCETWLKMESIR